MVTSQIFLQHSYPPSVVYSLSSKSYIKFVFSQCPHNISGLYYNTFPSSFYCFKNRICKQRKVGCVFFNLTFSILLVIKCEHEGSLSQWHCRFDRPSVLSGNSLCFLWKLVRTNQLNDFQCELWDLSKYHLCAFLRRMNKTSNVILLDSLRSFRACPC